MRQGTERQLTIVIVDDHAGFRAQARALLESEGHRVLGEAGDGPSACLLVQEVRPDVVVLDIQLPGMDGFEVAGLLTAADGSGPDVVLVSSRDASTYGSRLARSRARGFIAKDELSGQALVRLLADRR